MKKMLKIATKCLAVFLSILFIVEILPTQVMADTTNSWSEMFDPNNIGETVEEYEDEENHAELLYEDTSKRDEKTKHFRMSDGTYQAVMYEMPVHIEQNGEWLDYNNTLIEVVSKDSSERELTNTFGDYSVRLSKRTNNDDLVSFSKDGYDVSWHFVDSKKQSAKVITAEDDGDATTLENLISEVVYEGVFKNTNLQYFVMPEQLKENIILESKSAPKVFAVKYSAEGLAPSLLDAKTVALKDEKGDIKFVIEAPYMTDATGEASTYIKLDLSDISESGFVLKISMDEEWLSSKDREYPVVVDPTFHTSQNWEDETMSESAYISSDNPSSCYGKGSITHEYEGSIYVGKTNDRGKTRGLIKVPNLPTLGIADKVVHAEMAVCVRACYPEHIVKLYRVTSSWTQSTVCWNSNVQYDSTIVDYQTIPYMEATDQNADRWQRFEVTDLVRGWYSGDYSNNGVLLYSDTENNSSQSRVWLFGSGYTTYSTPRPVMLISYRNMSGYEDYWSYTSVAAGRNGTASVNNYNGNLVFTQPVTQDAGGNLMPVTVSLTYNSNRENSNYSGFGNNIQSNYNVYVKAETNTSINEHYKYFLNDADGTKHWFYFETSSSTTAKDEDGLGYTFDIITIGSDANCTNARYRITDKDKNKMYFNSDGYLIQIRNANNITNTLTYSGGKITTITDGAGRVYTYNYNGSNYCTSIIDPANRSTNFEYSSGYISKITFPDGKFINLVHASNLLNKIYDIDGLSTTVEYDSTSAHRAIGLSWGNEGTGQLLNRYAFEYKQNETKIKEQYRTNSQSSIVTTNTYVYQFNDFGQNTSIVSENDNKAKYCKYNNNITTGSAVSAKNNKLASESKVVNTVDNRIKNHNFQNNSLSDFVIYDSNNGTATVDTSTQHLDRNSLKLINTNPNGYIIVAQDLYNLPAGDYTFSAYVKTDSVTGDGVNIGLERYNNDHQYDYYVYSDFVNVTDGWERISVSITVPQGFTLRIICGIRNNSIGTAWLDNLQIEKGISVSSYNMLENSCFNNSNTRWTRDTIVENISGLGNITKALTRTAQLSENNTSSQNDREKWLGISQYVYTSGSKGDVFNIGAWVKANSAPINDLKTGDTYIPRFALALHFYNGNNPAETSEVKINPDVRSWQFVTGQAVAPCNYDKVCFEVIYYNNVNSVSITGGFCNKENSTDNYAYDDNGNLISAVDLAESNSRFAYRNNSLVTMLNPSGSDYTYAYDNYGNIHTAFSTDGLKYSVRYDNKGNPTTATTKGVKYTTTIDTSKSYEIINQLTSYALDWDNNADLINYHYVDDINSQQWNFESCGNGVYKIKLGNRYLRVKDTSAGEGAKLELVGTNDNSSRYLFTIVPTVDGAVVISNTSTGALRYLDSTDGVTQTVEDHSYVTLRTLPERNACQKWYLIEDYTEEMVAGKTINSTATYTADKNFISTQTDQAGNTTTYNYNTTKGTLSSVTNAAGVSTNYTYDSNTNALLSVSSGGMTNSYSYLNDRLTDINVNGGTKYKFEYDGFGRTTATKVGNGTAYQTLASLSYNSRSLLERQTYGNGDYINYSYDSLDRITEKSYNNGVNKKQYYYGNDGNISVTTDSASNSYTKYFYDSVGRVISVKEYPGTDISSHTAINYTNYTYAPKTNYLTKQKHFSPLGTQNIEFVYGQLSSSQMPDQVYSVKWNGATKLTNSFDHLARLSKRTVNGLDTDYTYVDRDANLTTTLVNSVSTIGVTHTYTYDELGNIASIYDGSRTTTYEYDDLNQLVRVNDPYENLTHIYSYENGNITEDRVFAYTTAQTPSNPQRATQYLYENSTWADLLTETRDVYFSDRSGGTNTAENAENALANALLNGRYTKVDMSAKLSGNGNNRTEFLDGEYPVTSDAIGNITSYNGFTYSYLGRQLQGLNNGESGVSYGYNADGQRISKSYDSIEGFALDYEYYYNGSTLAGFRLYVIDCVEAEEYLVSFMYDENGEPFGFTVDGDSYYYVRNAQNDIFLIVDSDNQGVVLYQYDAWGNVTACYDTSDGSILSLVNPYTYRGYYYDIETGYYYLNSRYYSPQLHRFISADGYFNTHSGILSHNMFAYCNNNPINYVDHTGTSLAKVFSFIKKYAKAIVAASISVCKNLYKQVLKNKKYSISKYAKDASMAVVDEYLPGVQAAADIVSQGSSVNPALQLRQIHAQNVVNAGYSTSHGKSFYVTRIDERMFTSNETYSQYCIDQADNLQQHTELIEGFSIVGKNWDMLSAEQQNRIIVSMGAWDAKAAKGLGINNGCDAAVDMF